MTAEMYVACCSGVSERQSRRTLSQGKGPSVRTCQCVRVRVSESVREGVHAWQDRRVSWREEEKGRRLRGHPGSGRAKLPARSAHAEAPFCTVAQGCRAGPQCVDFRKPCQRARTRSARSNQERMHIRALAVPIATDARARKTLVMVLRTAMLGRDSPMMLGK